VTKLAFGLFSLSTLITSGLAYADQGKVLYGEDNRQDVYQTANETHRLLAKSTAAMIPNAKINPINEILTQLRGVSLQSLVNLCSDEAFASQVTSANCSGFLVSEFHLVTAGHCITNNTDCLSNKWVFDYAYETVPDSEKAEFFVDQTKVYSCRKILERSQSNGKKDYAVIELDRAVVDRLPLKLRTEGQITVGTPLVVIGHPTGLPTKITDGGKVHSTSSIEFTADLDTYGGNSGSAVFNDITGEVEGILVRGANDYVVDSTRGCRVSSKCKSIDGTERCRGEMITKITGIRSLVPELRPATFGEITAFLESQPSILSDLTRNSYKNCSIKTTPIYNQLYVNKVFRGNFSKGSDDQKLKQAVASFILNGTCVKNSNPDVVTEEEVETPVVVEPIVIPVIPEPIIVVAVIDPVADQAIIDDFIDLKYLRCFVKTKVRNFNQLYINGYFKGNFVIGRQNNALAEAIRASVASGLCVAREN
jgi:V8-like Glu-specific endopeptidase